MGHYKERCPHKLADNKRPGTYPGFKRITWCCYADSWSDIQFQRMPNVSIQPGRAVLNPADMIKQVEKGIYIVGDGSYPIYQQRYNFQFSGQLFYEIKNGKIVGMLKDAAYQSNTQEFWNSCTAIPGIRRCQRVREVVEDRRKKLPGLIKA